MRLRNELIKMRVVKNRPLGNISARIAFESKVDNLYFKELWDILNAHELKVVRKRKKTARLFHITQAPHIDFETFDYATSKGGIRITSFFTADDKLEYSSIEFLSELENTCNTIKNNRDTP